MRIGCEFFINRETSEKWAIEVEEYQQQQLCWKERIKMSENFPLTHENERQSNGLGLIIHAATEWTRFVFLFFHFNFEMNEQKNKRNRQPKSGHCNVRHANHLRIVRISTSITVDVWISFSNCLCVPMCVRVCWMAANKTVLNTK